MPKDGGYYFRYHDYGVDIATIPHIKGIGVNNVLKLLKISKRKAMAIMSDECIHGTPISGMTSEISLKPKISMTTTWER